MTWRLWLQAQTSGSANHVGCLKAAAAGPCALLHARSATAFVRGQWGLRMLDATKSL